MPQNPFNRTSSPKPSLGPHRDRTIALEWACTHDGTGTGSRNAPGGQATVNIVSSGR
jgi:hypothetical protein